MRLKHLILVGGLILSGLPLVAEAASSELRPKARPASLVVQSPVAAAAPRAEVAASELSAPQNAAQPEVASALRPKARTAALSRRFGREAEARLAAARVAPPAQPSVASVSTMNLAPRQGVIADARRTLAVQQANARRAKGQRVWCVPFARDLSGISLQGNAHTWWGKAAGRYERGHVPAIGAVMNFKSTRGMPLGHVAVVSKIESSRRIQIDHANWSRNKISLGMVVVDVSKNNDWSRVRLESGPGGLGGVYPVAGFIHPARS